MTIPSSVRRRLHRARRDAGALKVRALSVIDGMLAPTAPLPQEPIGEGPGGPIVVVASSCNPFGRYLAEILLAEGLNEFAMVDLAALSRDRLAASEIVLLGEAPLTAGNVEMLSGWVNSGGNLVAMRPDAQLAELLGLDGPNSTITDGYVDVDTSRPPGEGITKGLLQFHGVADAYHLAEAHSLATLWERPARETAHPAVTIRRAGPAGGHAAAFTYDLARSIVYTRQGNPALADHRPTGRAPRRSSDWFGSVDGSSSAWIDVSRIAIPQADEQQRLLANLIQQLIGEPLPRFWYFPRGWKAVVVMTGDDHGRGGTGGRFEKHRNATPSDVSPESWDGVRSTSYVSLETPLSDAEAAALTADGFEVALHISTRARSHRGRGADWTAASLRMFYRRQLKRWKRKFPSLPPPVTVRTHSVVWTEWATQPRVELEHGIRLDTNYYHWPADRLGEHAGFLTGSGIPMRFADLDGTMIDVYQAATQLTDESGQHYPETIDALLSRAVGPDGYFGVFTANVHTDRAASDVSDAIIGSALAHGVPVIPARRLLEWLDARSASSFCAVASKGDRRRFSVRAAPGAHGLVAMVPSESAVGAISRITHEGEPVSFAVEFVKGVPYALFPALAGAYEVAYSPREPASTRRREGSRAEVRSAGQERD